MNKILEKMAVGGAAAGLVGGAVILALTLAVLGWLAVGAVLGWIVMLVLGAFGVSVAYIPTALTTAGVLFVLKIVKALV